jgi:hypothetical protein
MTGNESQDQPQHWTAPTAPTMPMVQTAPLTPQTLPMPGSQAANQATINLGGPAAGELLRFGPGVPVPAATTDLSQAAAIWRGEAQPTDDDAARRRRRGRLMSWLLPILVLLAVLAILLWQRSGSSLTVTDAAVRATSQSLACDGTATITATIHTNGANGTITYRWRRSDGTESDILRQQTTKGPTDVHVVLLWSFHGHGSLNATATLEVLSPSQLSASATFAYSCP